MVKICRDSPLAAVSVEQNLSRLQVSTVLLGLERPIRCEVRVEDPAATTLLIESRCGY
jgi:hypothetical protein